MKLTKKSKRFALVLAVGMLSLTTVEAFAATTQLQQRKLQSDPFQTGSAAAVEEDVVEEVTPTAETEVATSANAAIAALSLTRSVNEALVYTAQDLKTALENPDIDTITFQNDIVMTIPAVKIDPRRSSADLIINGNGHSFTEYYVNTYDACKGLLINTHASRSTLKEVTLKNFSMIHGGNGYGTVYVSSAFCGDKAINLVYDNINYEGPQLTHNIYGSAEYIDSNITIDYAKKNGVQSGKYVGEVGELSYAKLTGQVNITKIQDKDGCTEEIFWLHCQATGIDVDSGAVVNVVNETDEKCVPSGFVYGSKANTTFNIGQDAKFNYTGYSVFSEGIPFYYVNVEENAEVNIEIEGGRRGLDACKPAVEVKDTLIVDYDAVFNLTAKGNAKKAILEVGALLKVNDDANFKVESLENTQGPCVSSPTVLIGAKACTNDVALEINNPERFLIYNSNIWANCKQDAALGFTKTVQSDISAFSIQYWADADMDVDSDRAWEQADPYNVVAKVGCHPLSKVSSVNATDYTGSYPFTKENYCFSRMNIILINGESSFQQEKSEAPEINRVTEDDTVVTGTGIPGSAITVTFPDGDEIDTTVDGSGSWSVNTNGGKTYDVDDIISATQTETGKLESDPATTVVEEVKRKSTPPKINEVTEDDTVVTGTGIPGSAITVTFPDGDEIETTVDGSGSWSVNTNGGKTYDVGDIISATQTETGKLESDPTTTVVKEVKRKSAPPRINKVTEEDTVVTGSGIPGSAITVTFPDGDVINTIVDGGGSWSVNTSGGKTYDADEIISATQTETGKLESDPATVTVDGVMKKSDSPIISPVSSSDTVVSGFGVPGSTVKVTFPDGDVIETTVDGGGSWSVNTNGGKTYNPYTDIFASQTTPGKLESDQTYTTVYENTLYSDQPIIFTPVTDLDTTVSGVGVPGSIITIYFPDDTVYVTVDGDGNWTADTPSGAPYSVGDLISVTQTEQGKQESSSVDIFVEAH